MVNRGRPFCFDHYWSRVLPCSRSPWGPAAATQGANPPWLKGTMLKSPRKTILKQKLFTEAEAVNCLVLRCARYCCAVGISSFVAGDTSRDSALTCAFAVAVSYLNLLPKIWIYVLTRLFNGIYRSIGIKDGQLHTWIERDWRKDHCPKISLQLSSGARGTNLALNIPDQAFVLGTSPKFATSWAIRRYGKIKQHKRWPVKQFCVNSDAKLGRPMI